MKANGENTNNITKLNHSDILMKRPLSYYQRNPDALSLPPEGPNSGYLVIQDEESETYRCFGLCKNYDIMDMPVPQNKKLTVRYESGSSEHRMVRRDDVMFIPVLNKPLSFNQYYAIKNDGKRKGQAFTCSKEEDKQTRCFCRCVQDVKPKPLDPEEAYQQFEICLYDTSCNAKGHFFAKSIAPDGFPPYFLRRKGWSLLAETPKSFELNHDALGLNVKLRQQLPEFNFTPCCKSSEAVVVGKWYCPFVFIKDGTELKQQMKRSMFYEMTLEQRWEQFFNCQNDRINEGNSVLVDVALDTEVVLIGGTNKATWDDKNVVEGVIWFRSYGKDGNEVTNLGLRREIFQRMKWEQERGGWQNQARIKQVEENRENGTKWKRFSCYVLVESFVLRRIDKSLAMTYDFKHIDKVKSLWE